MLGGVVDAAAGKDDLAAHRAEVDDPSRARAAHPGQHQLAHPHQPEDVGLELPADAVHRHRLDRAALAVARVVDQGADRPVLLSTSATALSIERSSVTSSAQRLAAALLQVLDRLGVARGRVTRSSRRRPSRSAVALPIPVEQPVISTGRDFSIPIAPLPSIAERGDPLIGSCHASGHLPGAGRGPGRRASPSPSCSSPTTRSSGSRRAASAARTSTSTTGGSDRAGFMIGHEFVGEVLAAGDEVEPGGGRRPGARLLLHRLRRVLLLQARGLPQVRPRHGLRPRQDARRPAGRPGRAGAGPARRTSPCARSPRASPTTSRCSPAT